MLIIFHFRPLYQNQNQNYSAIPLLLNEMNRDISVKKRKILDLWSE